MADRSDENMITNNIDKSSLPVCNILGVNIAAVDMLWTVDFIKRNLRDLSGKYICVSNVHTTVMSYEDDDYRTIQNRAVMALPDGGPLSTLGKKRGYSDMKRVTGPDLMGEIFKISVENGYRHFFYGSTEETIKKLKKNLGENYPGIEIVGMISPPFRPLSDIEDKKDVIDINLSTPDFVWIGLGAPKQEYWMAEHKDKIKGLMIGVGAGFDYFAGSLKRAPKWMQRANLEWLYRLIQNPSKLFKRYLLTNIKFLWLALKGR
jgi:N-acetylglucosaminyldiphosphoundecaprenol N-acetyl-beta-D-mannosaminyltransferase